MQIIRGDSSTRQLRIEIPDDFTGSFDVVFTVKDHLDADTTDSKSVIKKVLKYPGDFTDFGQYKIGSLRLTKTDTLLPEGEYKWNIRFISDDEEEISSSTNGDLEIVLGATQIQEQV